MVLDSPASPLKGFLDDMDDEISRRMAKLYTPEQLAHTKAIGRPDAWIKAKDPLATCREFSSSGSCCSMRSIIAVNSRSICEWRVVKSRRSTDPRLTSPGGRSCDAVANKRFQWSASCGPFESSRNRAQPMEVA